MFDRSLYMAASVIASACLFAACRPVKPERPPSREPSSAALPAAPSTPAKQERGARAEKGIRRLGSEDPRVREEATGELLALGVKACPVLKDAADSADPEVAERARAILGEIVSTIGRC